MRGKIHLIVRGFLGREEVFAVKVRLDMHEEVSDVIASMAEEHATDMAAGRLTMIEFEFLDELDPNERFFRIGTSPEGMVMPIGFNL